MRALRVVGLDDDGKFVICEDTERRERFTIPADERLRAAARGDVTRLGQIEIERESQMRPREIQARIRAGESTEQVAESSGMAAQRIERFAYPVLLERSRTAELAQGAHPVRDDGPDVQVLGEVVAHAFGLRGQDYSGAEWDAWRGEDGRWIVALNWQAGKTDNHAHWVYAPGAHGGTVTPFDESAAALLDPNPARPLRTVTSEIRAEGRFERRAEESRTEPEILAQEDAVVGEPVEAGELGPPVELVEPTRETPENDAAAEADGTEPDAAQAPTTGKGKKSHPIVPAWEDVLLGVKSTRG